MTDLIGHIEQRSPQLTFDVRRWQARAGAVPFGYLMLVEHIIHRIVTEAPVAKLDFVYLLGGPTRRSSLVNVIAPGTFTGIAEGGVIFEPLEGFTGNGTDGRINTGFNPTTAVGSYQQNSAHFGGWFTKQVDSDTDHGLGQASGTSVRMRPRGPSQYGARINSTSGITVSGLLSGTGHFAMNRSASGATQHYRNGVLLDTGSEASTALNNSNLTLLFGSGNWSQRGIIAAHAGGSLSASEVAVMADIFREYVREVELAL